jgi:hypothetical protein
MLSIDSTETPPLASSKFTSRESELAWTTFIYLKPPSVIHYPCAHPAAHFWSDLRPVMASNRRRPAVAGLETPPLLLLLLFATATRVALCARTADRVFSLPGLQASLPSALYSGFLASTPLPPPVRTFLEYLISFAHEAPPNFRSRVTLFAQLLATGPIDTPEAHCTSEFGVITVFFRPEYGRLLLQLLGDITVVAVKHRLAVEF